ncbi:MAG TPA: RDD family protein [Chloroflexota bacterium]|jgi:uncharacterized RDD family membrane protein YckC|nr:RDD family protein [Chloroflexota bacterium]
MASTDFQVLTPERVCLQYDIAGIGSRGAAVLLDTLIQVGVGTVVLLAFSGGALSAVSFVGRGGGLAGPIVLAGMALAVFAISIGYFIVFEIIWSGQTPGKRVLGIRAMRENGYPLRPIDSTIRNVLRVVDGLPVGYAVGVLVMLFNARSKRLGDFAASTIVVREGARSWAAFPSTEEPSHTILQPADATLVRDFLIRRGTMSSSARRELAARLAAVISSRYGLALEGDPEVFLDRLGA